MNYAFEGWPIVDAAHQNESQLSRITKRMRRIGRWFFDTMNQPGRP